MGGRLPVLAIGVEPELVDRIKRLATEHRIALRGRSMLLVLCETVDVVRQTILLARPRDHTSDVSAGDSTVRRAGTPPPSSFPFPHARLEHQFGYARVEAHNVTGPTLK